MDIRFLFKKASYNEKMHVHNKNAHRGDLCGIITNNVKKKALLFRRKPSFKELNSAL